MLGGSSSINGLMYIRGQAEDFDHWRQLGNAGWSYDRCAAVFRRSEDQQRGEDELHGVGGPLSVRDVREGHPLCDAFIDACEQAGLPRTEDFNGPTQEGAGYFQLTTRKGGRWSTARGYLKPARKRPNVAVVSNALTTRILFEGRRAVGVEYIKDGARHVARANGEVILSSGAFNSPQLMQLSGVGPGELLRQHGIEVVADMKGVGADLQDHYQARFNYRCTTRNTINDMMGSWSAASRRVCATRCSARASSPSAPAMRAVSSRPIPRCRPRTCNFISSCSRLTRSDRSCIPGPASSPRYASFARKAAASCASSRPIPRRRRRSSRAT